MTVEVTALDGKERPLPNLKKEDFQLYEDGKKQEIATFDEVNADTRISDSNQPLSKTGIAPRKTVIIIFMDNRLLPQNAKRSRDSAERYVKKHMNARDLFAVASYKTEMKIHQNFTGDKSQALAAIARSKDSEDARHHEDLLLSLEAINKSVENLKGQKSALIYEESKIVQTGLSTIDWAEYDRGCKEVVKSARKANVVYYTIDPSGLDESPMFGAGLSPKSGGMASGSPKRSLNLSSMAVESGGFSIHDTNGYDGELDKLDRQISNYYILGFQSSNPRHDGSYRKLEVKTGLRGVTLKHRNGYFDRLP